MLNIPIRSRKACLKPFGSIRRNNEWTEAEQAVGFPSWSNGSAIIPVVVVIVAETQRTVNAQQGLTERNSTQKERTSKNEDQRMSEKGLQLARRDSERIGKRLGAAKRQDSRRREKRKAHLVWGFFGARR